VNYGSLLDAAGAQALAFAWLRDAVAPAGDYGRRAFDRLEPFAPGQEAAAAARAASIAELARSLPLQRIDALREAFGAAPDALGAIARASMGDALSDAQFLELVRWGDAVRRVDVLLAGSAQAQPVAGEAFEAVMAGIEPGRAGAFGFYLGDAFDERLREARARLAALQAEFDAARGREIAAVAAELGRDVSTDEFIVMRSDLRGSLPLAVRVLREAPTYVLCTLQYGAAALAALERRDAAANAVAEAEETVRRRLSSLVRAHAAALDRAAAAFGALDVAVAAARFAAVYQCAVPRVEADAPFEFAGGRFLPLALELEVQGRSFTPIDVRLSGIAVLTGPNMGGKSVCLRTCGFVAMCAAFGLPVPAAAAQTPLFDEIAWLGIGSGEERLGGLLSSFAREVVRLRDVLERAAPRLFVLIDEFARTTTPNEGKALLVALIERLRERGACGMAATHLSGVARAAGSEHFAVKGLRGIPQRPPTEDLNEALTILAETMDYRIAPVGAQAEDRSDAIALAALLGLDDELVARAYAAL